MKIDPQNLTATVAAPPGAAAETRPVDRDGPVAGTAPGAGAHGDRVELSGLAGRVQSGLAARRREQQNRVEHLTKQFQSGKYAPDARPVSHALVAETLAASGGASAPAKPSGKR